jgi:hypothetical protein
MFDRVDLLLRSQEYRKRKTDGSLMMFLFRAVCVFFGGFPWVTQMKTKVRKNILSLSDNTRLTKRTLVNKTMLYYSIFLFLSGTRVSMNGVKGAGL